MTIKHTPGGPPCPECGVPSVDHEVEMSARGGGGRSVVHRWHCHNPECELGVIPEP